MSGIGKRAIRTGDVRVEIAEVFYNRFARRLSRQRQVARPSRVIDDHSVQPGSVPPQLLFINQAVGVVTNWNQGKMSNACVERLEESHFPWENVVLQIVPQPNQVLLHFQKRGHEPGNRRAVQNVGVHPDVTTQSVVRGVDFAWNE